MYLFDLVEAAGFGVKSELVWDKGTPGMGVGWRSQHELILFARRQRKEKIVKIGLIDVDQTKDIGGCAWTTKRQNGAWRLTDPYISR